MSAGVLVIMPVCPGSAGCHQGARASGGQGGETQKHPGAFSLAAGDRAGRLSVRFAEAEQCLHFIPLLLLCLVCLVNSREDKGSSPRWLSTPAVLLGGFHNPVPLGK